MLAHHPLIAASDRLYFAYGSNLSPEQMARRCPDSIFLGKATLRGHSWQINERGVANVVKVPVPAAGSKGTTRRGRSHSDNDKNGEVFVEGLIYAISASDERKLDAYEGVAKGRYDKSDVEVDFEPVRDNVFARCTSDSVARAVRQEREAGGGLDGRARSWGEGEGESDRQRRRRDHRPRDGGRRGASVGSSASSSSSSSIMGGGSLKDSILELLGIPTKSGRAPSPSPARGERGHERVVAGKPYLAFMYASKVYVRDGDVSARYVPRLERAMADAVALGVSKRFIEKQMVPRIWGNRPARSSWRMSLAGGGDGQEREKSRERGEDAKRRTVSQREESRRRGRRDSVVMDRHRDD